MNDELQRRINAHVLNGDAPSIIWAMEGQIRINTELEAENAALRELVAAYDVYYRWAQVCDHEGCAAPEGLLPLLGASSEARVALVALGFPLPGCPTYEEMSGGRE